MHKSEGSCMLCDRRAGAIERDRLALLRYTHDRSERGIAQSLNRPGRSAQIVFLVILVGILALALRAALC